eukprot:6200778-Pleurochrysis_carterae.AAC.3
MGVAHKQATPRATLVHTHYAYLPRIRQAGRSRFLVVECKSSTRTVSDKRGACLQLRRPTCAGANVLRLKARRDI